MKIVVNEYSIDEIDKKADRVDSSQQLQFGSYN